MGTYTLGIYSRFREQAIRLSNGVIAEDYSIHSPRLLSDDGNGNKEMTTYNGDQMETGHLVYPSLVTSTYYNEDGTSVEYNPLTGESVSYFNALGATVPAFGVCKQNSDCVAPDNAAEVICDTLTNDQKDTRCFPLYWEKADAKCVAGSEAYDLGGEWAASRAISSTTSPTISTLPARSSLRSLALLTTSRAHARKARPASTAHAR